MKSFARFVGGFLALIGLALAGLPAAAGVASAAGSQAISNPSLISEDNSDNEDGGGGDEGTGVVDPVPQDDGSPGTEEDD
jgi:hypothetical protein